MLIFSATHNDLTCYHSSPSNEIKLEGILQEWEFASVQTKKNNPENEASLSVIWLRSSHAVVREMP